MNARLVAKQVLPPIAVDVVKYWSVARTESKLLQQYLRSGRVPWSPGYHVYKKQLIARTIKDRNLRDRFRTGAALPPGYGAGVDERCVEYPWLLSRLGDQTEVLLDAGSTLNHDYILEHPVLRHKLIHIHTLEPEEDCFWTKGISYIFGDLRNSPIRDDYYDVVACISTLEHVGFDNCLFAHGDAYHEHRPGDFELVLREFRRILKPGGTLFLTVPFGVYRDIGTQQQFDRATLARATASFGAASRIGEVFYRYTAEGWNVTEAEECADCEYVDWIMRPRRSRSRDFPVQPDGAVAARAVACVEIVK